MRLLSCGIAALIFGLSGPAQAVVCNVGMGMAYTTIQSAASDMACTEIVVAAGVFVEQVTIGRPMSILLRGQGAGRTIIRSPAMRQPSTLPTTYFPNYTYVLQVPPGQAANIQDLTIDGTGNSFCGEPLFGVRFNNAAGSLERVVVENMRSPGAALGCQNGIAVASTAEGAGQSSLGVYNSVIRNFQKVGFLVNGPLADGIIQNTKITGVGAQPFIAQNGIQFSRGGAGAADRNIISAIHYTGDACRGVANGIQNYQAGSAGRPTFITNNYIFDVDRGISLKESAGLQSVFLNRIVDALVGIASQNNAADTVYIVKNGVNGTRVSTIMNAATCFPESGNGIAMGVRVAMTDSESNPRATSNSVANNERDGILVSAGAQGAVLDQNQANRNARADIENLGSMTTFNLNNCRTSMPMGLCAGTP